MTNHLDGAKHFIGQPLWSDRLGDNREMVLATLEARAVELAAALHSLREIEGQDLVARARIQDNCPKTELSQNDAGVSEAVYILALIWKTLTQCRDSGYRYRHFSLLLPEILKRIPQDSSNAETLGLFYDWLHELRPDIIRRFRWDFATWLEEKFTAPGTYVALYNADIREVLIALEQGKPIPNCLRRALDIFGQYWCDEGGLLSGYNSLVPFLRRYILDASPQSPVKE